MEAISLLPIATLIMVIAGILGGIGVILNITQVTWFNTENSIDPKENISKKLGKISTSLFGLMGILVFISMILLIICLFLYGNCSTL